MFLLRCIFCLQVEDLYKKFKLKISKEMFMGTAAVKPRGVDQRQQDTVFLSTFSGGQCKHVNC